MLPNLFGNRDEVTVSGYSAGGAFSCNLMWTSSDTWKGAGCSKGWGFDYRWKHVKNLTPKVVNKSINKLKKLNDEGLIDPLSNLSSGNRAAYIISGKNDKKVPKDN